jgi:hypothetical protein
MYALFDGYVHDKNEIVKKSHPSIGEHAVHECGWPRRGRVPGGWLAL